MSEAAPLTLELSQVERGLVSQVSATAERGRAIRLWWQSCEAQRAYPEVFPLVRAFNPAEHAYGFFGQVGDVPVMGLVQRMAFDTSKAVSPPGIRDQVREFVLRYFLRVSDFSRPVAYAETGRGSLPRVLGPLSWCARERRDPVGFGYEQLFLRYAGSAAVNRVPAANRFEIADLRDLGPKLDWIILQVRIHDFQLKFQPFGPGYPGVDVPLDESNYLLVTPDLIVDDSRQHAGYLARFGLGYFLLKTPNNRSLLAYGPGEFRAGFQDFEFTVLEDGAIAVKMAFVVDRPQRILRIPADPVDWVMGFADFASFGTASRALGPLVDRRAVHLPDFDPLLSFISVTRLLTFGLSERLLCISKRQLEVDFLVQHFMQHYEMMAGAVLSWSRVRDWTNPSAIPEWMRQGVLT